MTSSLEQADLLCPQTATEGARLLIPLLFLRFRRPHRQERLHYPKQAARSSARGGLVSLIICFIDAFRHHWLHLSCLRWSNRQVCRTSFVSCFVSFPHVYRPFLSMMLELMSLFSTFSTVVFIGLVMLLTSRSCIYTLLLTLFVPVNNTKLMSTERSLPPHRGSLEQLDLV